MLSRTRIILTIVTATIALFITVGASTINYQGTLADSAGDPIADGSYAMTFRLYDDITGGDVAWTESRTVLVTKGYFSIYLGEVNPITTNDFSNASFLEIEVEGEILTPRTKLSDVPYSGVSKRLNGDIITNSTMLRLPGQNAVTDPRAVELSNSTTGGAVGIWGTGGTTQPLIEMVGEDGHGSLTMYPGHEWVTGPDTAMKMTVNATGGLLGIWGNSGTHLPSVELSAKGSHGGLTMYPGHEWVTGADTAIKMSVNADGGLLGIWGNSGTHLPLVELSASGSRGGLTMYPGSEWVTGPDTAMKMSVNDDGGLLGIWGSNGTSQPLVELSASGSRGGLTMYPGHEWVTGPDTAIKMTVNATGGLLGIWGTNGTSQPLVELSANGSRGGLTMYPGHEWVTGPDTAMKMSVSADGGIFSVWGTGSTNLPAVAMMADSNGGHFTIRNSDGGTRVAFYSDLIGDGSTILPTNAINALEMLDEPGLTQGILTTCQTLTLTSMVDVITTTIDIPAAGYIVLIGSGMTEFGGTLLSNRIDVQIDETSGGSGTFGQFHRLGLAAYTGSSYHNFGFSLTRTYFKSAGSHTFRLEARRLTTNGSSSVCNGTLTAMYIPTSYGTVSAMAELPDDNPDSKSMNSRGLGGEDDAVITQIDLRYYELRAREAKLRALEAELELRNAQIANGTGQ